MKKLLLEIAIKSSLFVTLPIGLLLLWPNLSSLPLNEVGSLALNLATPSASPNNSTPSANKNGGGRVQNSEASLLNIDPTGRFIEDELIVKFKDGVTAANKQGSLSKFNATFTWEELDLGGAKVIKVSPATREKLMQALKKNPNVEYVEPNLVVQTLGGGGGYGSGSCSPNDYYYCYGNYQWAVKRIQARSGWNLNKGSSSIAIAVIDSGVDYNHYDLGWKVIKGRNFWNNNYDPMDENGHGTGVAGIAAAITNNSSAIAGVGWYTKIVAIKIAGSSIVTSASLLAAGIREAVNEHPEVKVINLSISLVDNQDLNSVRSAVQHAQRKGALLVAGVKNSSPGNYNCFQGFPAAYSGVVSVVATDINDQHASGCTGRTLGSKKYENVWVSAPGSQVFSLKKNSGFGYLPGAATSWATPFVSGIASILANGPSNCNTAPLIGLAIKYGTDDLGTAGWDLKYGQGRVNLYKALDVLCY